MRKVLLLIAFTPTLAAAIQILRLVAANAGFRIGQDDRFGSGRDIRFRKSALCSWKLLGAAHARNLQFQPV
jgi:hypothetical protein